MKVGNVFKSTAMGRRWAFPQHKPGEHRCVRAAFILGPEGCPVPSLHAHFLIGKAHGPLPFTLPF